MAESFLARITPVEGPEGPVDPGFGVSGGRPAHPIVLPPLPGVWPKPGEPSHPIYLPPTVWPGNPIFIDGSPEHPIQLPPGVVWPPLPPDLLPGEKKAVLIWVVGVGSRWYIYDPQQRPPRPEPKEGGGGYRDNR